MKKAHKLIKDVPEKLWARLKKDAKKLDFSMAEYIEYLHNLKEEKSNFVINKKQIVLEQK